MGLALPFLAAYLLDLLLGDPPYWPHPVRLLGRAITYWENVLYQPTVVAGGIFWLAVMGTILTGIILVLCLAALLPATAGIVLLTYFLYAGLATRSLHRESQQVEAALDRGDLPGARKLLALIVGRETAQLGPEEVRRAVLETVAENLADGVVAPMFFILLLGLPGLFLYKGANTMDSMVGYRNLRYSKFGKFAALADDVLNFLPARLASLLIITAAALLGLNWRQSWAILRRDAGKASSPNAGWPEAALAGALSVRLGGPSTYFGRLVDRPYLGDPGQPPSAQTYDSAIRLLYVTSLLMAALTFLILLISGAGIWGLLKVLF